MKQKHLLSFVVGLLFSLVGTRSGAQSLRADIVSDSAKPQTLMLLVRSSGIREIRNAFDSIRALLPNGKVNVQTLAWADSRAISSALDLHGIHPISLKPFIAQHSAALEDLREHLNPALFGLQPRTSGETASDIADLRASETKIARWFVLTYSDAVAPQNVCQLLKKSLQIEYAEPRFIRHTLYTPNDPLFSQQYGPQMINAPRAWDVVRCDSTIVIADVDVGSDWSHEDLAKSIYLNQGEIGLDSNGLDKRSNGVDDDGNGFVDDWHGWDFCGSDGQSPDNDARNNYAGHGTHTAGIAAATGDNSTGIVGIAFGSRLVPIKCAPDNNPGSLDFTFEGLIYAADLGAKVVNCSWGGSTRSQSEQDIVDYVTAKGMTVVAAAGNNGLYQEFYPASYAHVLSVGALEPDTSYSGYSNHSTHEDVCAPGTNVLSTVPGNLYVEQTGTSMACPHAVGSVALVMKRFPNFTSQQAAQQVRATCDSIPNNPFPDFTGHGRINLYRAVTETNAHSARLDSVEVQVQSGGSILLPGVSASIVLHVKNYLSPLANLQAKLEFECGTDVISTSPTLIAFGPVSTLGTTQNPAQDFQIVVGANAPDTTVLVKVTFFDLNSGYTDDIDYFTLSINPLYRDLNKNNLTVTFDQHGAIGYGDEQNNTEGNGFDWRNSPPSIVGYGKNILYAAGLMVGVDSNRVVSNAPGEPPGINDTDFTALAPIELPALPDKVNAIQELISNYSDTNALLGARVGVSVNERAYAFDLNNSANAVVVDYILKKRADSSGILPTDSASIAFYADWDIGLSGLNNVATFDSTSQSPVFYRIDPNYPWVGVTLLSPIPSGASLNYYADLNDGSDGSINTYGGLTRADKRYMMLTSRSHAGPGDVSMVYGLTNAPLLSADSVVFTISITLASSLESLRSSINDTRKAWLGPQQGVKLPTSTDGITVYPNPARDLLHLQWNSASLSQTTRIALSDALGRAVRTYTLHGISSYELDTRGLSSGIYFLTLADGTRVLTKSIVHTK